MAKKQAELKGAKVAELDPRKRLEGEEASKYTAERRQTILRHIANGCPRDIAARAAGICKATFYLWCEKDPQFAEEVEDADAMAEADAVGRITWSGRQDWKANAWWLERTRPERYRQRSDTNLGGQPDNPLIGEIRNVIVDPNAGHTDR